MPPRSKIHGRREFYERGSYYNRLGGAMWNRYRRWAWVRPSQMPGTGKHVTFLEWNAAIVWC